MSYANMVMYGAVLPSYRKPSKKGGAVEDEEVLRADDPKNKAKVRAFFDKIE